MAESLVALTPQGLAAVPAPTTQNFAASGGSALIGFIAAGVGAKPRTVQDKLRDFISVKDFGAKGDGVTDDTAAINAACSAVASGRIVFPAGKYRYRGGGVLADGAIVEGAGRNATNVVSTLASPTSGFLFNANGYGSGVRGMRFTAEVAQTAGCYVQLQGTESFIDDFYMDGDYNGVLMRGSVSRIRHGRFQNGATGAIRIRAEGGDCSQVIDDVLMGAQTPANISVAGIRVRNSSALMITNTSVIQQGAGLLIDPYSSTSDGADSGSVFSLYVNNCFFDTNTKALNIGPTGTGSVNRCRFANSWFSSSSSDGITVQGATSGMHFESCHAVLNAGAGLTTGSALGLSDVRISGGLFAQNQNGLYFNSAFPGLAIIGAVIGLGGGLNGNTSNGIVIADAAFDNYILALNTLRSNGTNISNAASSAPGAKIANNVSI